MKVLVIRFSSIGDIVLTSPVLRCLKQQKESLELHYLTKQNFALLLQNNPYIDMLHLWGKDTKATIKQLKEEQFDFVIDLHNNLRTLKIKGLLQQKTYSFSKLNIQKWMYVNLNINKLPDLHVVDRYFNALKPLNVQNDYKGLDFFIPKSEQLDLEKQFHTNIILAVAIGAKFNTKRLPLKKLNAILSEIDATIVLLGGKEDSLTAEELKKELVDKNVFNKCGELSILQSASVVKQAKVLMTHDTGLMHIATAYSTPIVSVWGSTVPAFGMYPYRPQQPNSFSIHEVNNLSCRPCSKIGYQKCPKKHFNCMNDQSVTEIVSRLKSYFSE